MVFGFIFFVARGCVATQQSTQVRKYVTSADSLLSDSSNAGRGELQRVLSNAGGDPAKLDDEALSQVANRSENQYLQALSQRGDTARVRGRPPLHRHRSRHKAEATDKLAQAASGSDGFEGDLATAVEDLQDERQYHREPLPSGRQDSLEVAGQTSDQAYLEEPQAFMDYGALGFDAAPVSGPQPTDPNALHGVQVTAVRSPGNPCTGTATWS